MSSETQTRAGVPAPAPGPGPRRVVITGRGAITPLGLTWDETWTALLDGRSGIAPLAEVDTTDIPVRFGGEVKGFRAEDHLPVKTVRRLDRTVHLALAAADQAVRDAGLEVTPELAPRAAVILGTASGPARNAVNAHDAMYRRGPRAVSPYFFPSSGVDSACGEVSLRFGLQGSSTCMVTACATGSTCLGEAMRMIRYGIADVVIAGGVDDSLTRVDINGAAVSRALSRRNDDPERACRPFDTGRDGFVMSAGAGVVVLESEEHALARGATIHGELAGYGATTDAFHVTSPHPEGLLAQRAALQALAEAGLRPDDVDYINAHGTSTPKNDTTEIKVIRGVFGSRAPRIPISSIKSMTGHMLGASGAVEAITSVEVIKTGLVPPTINCDDPEDPELDFVPHKARTHDVDVAISNSFGFGGHNAALVLRRWQATH
ncbi:beta-ketoacyl-ACP synthase II [Streptomyces sp. NPDC051243]|uniref:beta-ketoacyl-ACP synthase II n=1 Tax=Streptomyces sp. NPDC051243 TaxID=3365646 RepID=UPI00378E3743